MSEELKPCPFCGSEADFITKGRSWWAVECLNERNCGIFLPVDSAYTSKDYAIKAWNTRAREAA